MSSSHSPSRRVQARLRRRPAGDQSGDTVWLFDLDNTLHDASHAIFPAINRLMTAYVARVLGCDDATASRVRVDYWQRYGATLLGMIRHHGVDPADFLRAAHEFPELADMVRVRRGLAAHLRRLPGRKIIVTNAPQAYARAVLDIAGISHCFERVIAIEQMWVHGHLRPKPDRRMLRRLLAQTGIAPHRAVLVEDTLSHLKRYAGTGIRTAWVTGYLRTIAPSRPHVVAAPEASGSRGDAAVRSTLDAEDRQHASHAAQEHSVTLVAAESQVPPAAGAPGLSPQSQPENAPRVRARVPNRPAYVDIKVQSMHQLQQRLRRTGS
ncbi:MULTISPECIES: pyrimidine 5'-nucleotidase [Cupriavidus]|uniref:HAD-superfamily hydrolase subfamily IA, variant 3:Pyrimidine 5-nucleotidase n=1 Tax=Cupriavidus pinatubonensis (strain JMP 134 / LMG 1197) TaxID=264198 RepID=Q476X0_CUPPJ|nr:MULTISPECIES: pyrimidine 5'-nucleotidase [Cupriavidus]QYY31803.1 pyrimidine 5'-nucleotidase [Cupriavidus pinatubonensis]